MHFFVQCTVTTVLQSPAAHVGICSRLSLQKLLLVGEASQKRSQERNAVLVQLFRYVLRGGIVIGHHGNGLAFSDCVGDDIQNRLGLAGTRRPLDHADLGRKRVLHRLFLTLVQSEGIDQGWRIFFDGDRKPWIEILGKHRVIRNRRNHLILPLQNVDAAIGFQAECTGSLLEIIKEFPRFCFIEAVLFQFNLGLWHCPRFPIGTRHTIELAEILNMVNIHDNSAI